MTDRPIIFSAPMIRALLDGRKTQTRRVLKLPKNSMPSAQWESTTFGGDGGLYAGGKPVPLMHGIWDRKHGDCIATPYTPDDRLWVRENCSAIELEDGTDVIRYHADGSDILIKNTMDAADRWSAMSHYGNRRSAVVPSIHMPRWASRLTLIVTDVRVQRVQEISEADAVAEGAPAADIRMYPEMGTARHWFADLWNSIHGPDAWDANPWVTAISFDVKRGNIDEYEVLK